MNTENMNQAVNHAGFAFFGLGVTAAYAACAMNELNRTLDRLEKTNPAFAAMREQMEYRCLPWYKKLWKRITV